MELGNNLEKLKEYLLNKGFVIDEFGVYNYKNYTFFMFLESKHIDFYLSKFSEIGEDKKEGVSLIFYDKFDSKDLAKLKTIISLIINN